MTPIRKVASGSIRQFAGLPDDEAELIASTASQDRMGDVIDQGEGAIDYRAWMVLGGTILRDHDNRQPVANTIRADALPSGFRLRIRFPDWGTSDVADETRRLVKAGVLAGVSIGFRPIDYELRSPNKPSSGLRFKRIEILEVSLCSVPANSDAMVVGKSYRQRFTPSTPAPAPEREPMPIHYSGTLKERQWQADWDNDARRRRIAFAMRLKAGLP